MGEPFADPSAANLFAIAQLARQSVTVVLTGDGGDEGFGGYTEAWLAHLAGRVQPLLPRAVRRLLAQCVGPLRSGPAIARRAGTMLHMLVTPLEKAFGEMWPADECDRDGLYTAEFRSALGTHHPRAQMCESLMRRRTILGRPADGGPPGGAFAR